MTSRTILCASLAGIVYAFAVRLLTDDWISGWAGLFIAVMFFGGGSSRSSASWANMSGASTAK